MAIVSLNEFAELLGMPYNTVKKNAQRGNIIKGTDGKIDTENPINKIFFDKKKVLILSKPSKIDTESVSLNNQKQVTKHSPRLTDSQKQYSDIDLRTRLATAELKERESELKRIQIEKVAGNLLPVDLCEKIIVINVQSILKSFRSERENMTSIFVERFGGSRKDLVEINTALDKIMDMAISKAQKDASYELEGAIGMYQEVRSRGERKI